MELYTIETLSNLHVGAGDINFDVIDNQVQKDAVTLLPTINSSSLKGAFRESFRELREEKEKPSNAEKYIFGQDNKSNQTQAGAYSFFEAKLLTRPVRSNVKSYFNATSPSVIKNFLETITLFDIDFDEVLKKELEKLLVFNPKKGEPIVFQQLTSVMLEDYEATYENFDTSGVERFLGENLALFEDSDFQALDLPVLARNVLDENGVSQNLWYEEVVPSKTKFFFLIGVPDNLANSDKKEKLDGYNNHFNRQLERPIQFGANKSIGYGYSKVQKVSK